MVDVSLLFPKPNIVKLHHIYTHSNDNTVIIDFGGCCIVHIYSCVCCHFMYRQRVCRRCHTKYYDSAHSRSMIIHMNLLRSEAVVVLFFSFAILLILYSRIYSIRNDRVICDIAESQFLYEICLFH